MNDSSPVSSTASNPVLKSADSARRRTIILLDDEAAIRRLLKVILEGEGYEVLDTDDGKAALEMIRQRPVDLIIQDLRMPKMDGLTFLRLLKEQNPDLPSIVLTAFGTFETAIEAMRLGAYTHLSKPFDTEDIRLSVTRALERIEFRKKTPRSGVPFLDIVSNTAAMKEVSRQIDRIAPTDSTVLVTGESGTGKELVARAVHYRSLRAEQPFVPANCGAFTESLLESELFGHIKGAFTNAIADHKGVFECADRGTLFLDEVGELTLPMQVKLLRVLETRLVKPVGGTKELRADVRFIAATNRDLTLMVEDGQFREDLFYRLNVIPIELPPLRERKEDIPLLAGHFLARFSKRMTKRMTGIDDAVIEKLLAHSWPGNVRELENTIERAVAFATGERITLDDMTGSAFAINPRSPRPATSPRLSAISSGSALRATPAPGSSAAAAAVTASGAFTAVQTGETRVPPEGMDLETYLLDTERACILEALNRSNWNLTDAAKLLNMTFRSIRYRIAKLGIEKPNKI